MKISLLSLLSTCLLAVILSPSRAFSDVYVYKDKEGVLTFTNVPTHAGYRRVIRESNGQWSGALDSSNGSGSYASYDEVIRSASDRHNIDPHLIRAVIKVRADFDSIARSSKGVKGLMHLTPETAGRHNVLDVFQPTDNIEGGVRHLKVLLSRYQGDLELSLAVYNAGIKDGEKHGGI